MAIWSEVLLSDHVSDLRLDSEFYQPDYLKLDRVLTEQKSAEWGSIDGSFIVGPFGSAFIVENYVEWSPYRYIRGRDVKPFFLLEDDNCYIPEGHFRRLSKYRLQTGDLLVSVVGTLGHVSVVTEDVGNAIFSCKSTAFRSIGIDPYYLCAYLNSRIGQMYLHRMIRGHVQTGLNLCDLKTIPILLMSAASQQMISDTVQSAYSKKQQSKELYSRAEALLLEELGLADFVISDELFYERWYSEVQAARRFDAEYFQPKYDEIAKAIKNYKGGWDTLGNLVSVKKCVEVGSGEYLDEGIPFIRVSNLSLFELTEEKYIFEKLYSELTEHQPKKGEILLSKDATPGIAYYLQEELQKMIPSGGILRLKLKDNRVNEEYLTLVLNSLITKEQINRDVGGSVILHWRPDQVKQTLIPVADKKIQNQIQRKITESFNLRKQSKHLLECAKKVVEMAIEKNEKTATQWLKKQAQNN